MKKFWMIILIVLLFVTTLSGCAEKTENESKYANYQTIMANLSKVENLDLSQADGVLKEILDKGVLTIATSPDYPANEFIDAATGQIFGSEIILAQFVANSLNVELKIETMPFEGILAAIDTKKADLGISGFGYKPDRAENYELSIGYQNSETEVVHHTLLVRANEKDQYQSLADFKGKKIDAQANSLQEMYALEQIEDVQLQMVASFDQAILDLIAGKVDAVAIDGTPAKNYAEQSNGQIVSLFTEKGIEFDTSAYQQYAGQVIVAKKGETSLIDVINQILEVVNQTDGLYKSWYLAACEVAEISAEVTE